MSLSKEVGRTKSSSFSWTPDDCILYGLAVGAGSGAGLEELRFACEAALVPLPTFSSVAAREAGLRATDLCVDYSRVVHKSQTTQFHAPLPAAGTLSVSSRIASVEDQGPAKGAAIHIHTQLTDPSKGNLTASVHTVLQARGNRCLETQPQKRPRSVQQSRLADRTISMPVATNSALLYRLCGDRNPIHWDPRGAAAAGFPQPILHGLCLYGMVCFALVRECCAFESSRLTRLHMNFNSPVFPGDQLELKLWLESGGVSFEVDAPVRQSCVSRGGRAAWTDETIRSSTVPMHVPDK
jgi:acyl dehydratase